MLYYQEESIKAEEKKKMLEHRTVQYGINAILRDLYMNESSGHIENFRRMSDEDFNFPLNKIAPLISKEDPRLREAISAKERFVVTLRFLASGENFNDLSYTARMSPHIISKIVMDVCRALIEVLREQIQMPNSPDGWKMIAQKFEDECHFRNCIGALDGRHMAIVNPLHAGSTFYNYKGTFSIVLLAICDANYCFTYANIGAQGRISDGGVFNSCSLSEKLDRNTLHLPPPESLSRGRKPTPYVIVADSVFALKSNIMIPYSNHNSTVKGSRE